MFPLYPGHVYAQACTIITESGVALQNAKLQFATQCPGVIRQDCDPLNGGWQCSTENLPLRNSSGSVSEPSTQIPAEVLPEPSSADVLTMQAESPSQTFGQGWSIERSLSGFQGSGYIVWRGANDFRTSNEEPPAGINAYDFTISQAGTYEFIARVQARVGNTSAANDQDNDAWVKFTSGSATSGITGDASKWTKFFVSGADENWKNYSRGEQYAPTFFTDIQRDLTAGTHRVLVGGRSARFAIDAVGIQLVRASSNSEPLAGTPVDTGDELPLEPVVVAPISGSVCSALGSTLANAKLAYVAVCPSISRKDCDPVAQIDQWLCSSENISDSTLAPFTEPADPALSPSNSNVCKASGATLAQARINYANSCPASVKRDCDPLAGGWVCASGNIVNGIVSAGNTAPEPELEASIPSPPTPASETSGRFSNGDLLTLHYDNCPDRDDGHALVAGKAVVDKVGIANVLVVNGTCGHNIPHAYQPESEVVVKAVWGNDWLDSFNNETVSINISANRWAATLSNGNDVWIAEGGPSDFTAKVLRRISVVFPSVNRSRIHVVQHSSGENFNERQTSDTNIALVKQVANYIEIDNGNVPNNGTADLNTPSSSFVSIALQSRYAAEWKAAFDYLNPDTKLDFSDTVELLYIVDDTETRGVNEFADRYLR